MLWAWCTAYLDRERLPDRRVVVRFEFSDQPADNRRVWLLVDHGDAEVCKHDPGFEEDLIVETDARTLAYWHLKRIEWADAVRCGRIRIKGPRSLAHALPTWNRRGFEADEPVGYNHHDAGVTTDRDRIVPLAGTDRRGAVPIRGHLAS